MILWLRSTSAAALEKITKKQSLCPTLCPSLVQWMTTLPRRWEMPGSKSRPRVGVIKPRKQIHEAEGSKHYKHFLGVCIWEWRLPTVVSCQASTSLSQEQCKTHGAHIGNSLVDLEVDLLLEHSALIFTLKLATSLCWRRDHKYCIVGLTVLVVDRFNFALIRTVWSVVRSSCSVLPALIAKEIPCLSHLHISHRSGLYFFHSKITLLFYVYYLKMTARSHLHCYVSGCLCSRLHPPPLS